MLAVSLSLNIAVLVPVLVGLLRRTTWTERAFGAVTPARGILTAVYAAILGVSAVLLAGLVGGSTTVSAPAFGLLSAQVVYKVLSPVSVGTVRNPVVRSNLAIAAVHTVTLLTMAPTALTGSG